jgi:hypothetical protein
VDIDIVDAGYRLSNEHVPSQNWFSRLYATFDNLLDAVHDDVELRLSLERASQQLALSDGDYWNQIPFGINDRTVRDDKSEKIYFQWSQDYSRLIMDQGISNPNIEIIQSMFGELDSLLQGFAGDIVNMYIPNSEIFVERAAYPIVFKVVKYLYSRGRWATKPHCDKSIWTWILDSSDEECSIRIGPHTKILKLSSLDVPKSWLPMHRWKSKLSVEFPGLMATFSGISMQASPHGVKPVSEGEVRYSCIAFLIHPNIGLFEAQTDVPYIDDTN